MEREREKEFSFGTTHVKPFNFKQKGEREEGEGGRKGDGDMGLSYQRCKRGWSRSAVAEQTQISHCSRRSIPIPHIAPVTPVLPPILH